MQAILPPHLSVPGDAGNIVLVISMFHVFTQKKRRIILWLLTMMKVQLQFPLCTNTQGSSLLLFLLILCHVLVSGYGNFLRGGDTSMAKLPSTKPSRNTLEPPLDVPYEHYRLEQESSASHRALGDNEWFVTTECSNLVQNQPYKAKLELQYVYLIETLGTAASIPDLKRIERAIQNAVVTSLDACDSKGRPMYQVDASFTDTLASTGMFCCVAQMSKCTKVVRNRSLLVTLLLLQSYTASYLYILIALSLGVYATLFLSRLVSSRRYM